MNLTWADACRFATLVAVKQSRDQASGTETGRTTIMQNPVIMRRPMQEFQRITFDPQVMAGQACIRGMWITAALIIRLTAQGKPRNEILAEYPDLELESFPIQK